MERKIPSAMDRKNLLRFDAEGEEGEEPEEPLEPSLPDEPLETSLHDEPLETSLPDELLEPLEPSVAQALPDTVDDGYVEIEAGTNIGTAVVSHAVLQDRGFDATLVEAHSENSSTDSDEHMIRVLATDEAPSRAILIEVQTAI